jgi:AhpD family alkylhydroperoxidase
MASNESLTKKEKELVAVGASIASGCHVCTTYHFKAARSVGASEQEIRQAVNDALCVRNNATKIMAGLAEKQFGNAAHTDTLCASDKPLIGHLVSTGAAFALNCIANLETHVTAAQIQGATCDQIQTTLAIARMVKNMAGKQIDAVVAKAGEECADDCACHDDASNESSTSKCGCGEPA